MLFLFLKTLSCILVAFVLIVTDSGITSRQICSFQSTLRTSIEGIGSLLFLERLQKLGLTT